MQIRNIAEEFVNFEDSREYKIEELFHKSVAKSWVIKKNLSKVMNKNLDDQYSIINGLIPNNWIRLIGAGSGGYFLISSKIEESEINTLSPNVAIKGIFKAEISKTGLESFCL